MCFPRRRLRFGILANVVVVLLAFPRNSQAARPTADVYVGYSYLGNNAFNPNTGGLNGLQAAAHLQWNHLTGVELDVSHYGFGREANIQHTTTVLLGPRFTAGAHGIHLFVHGLAGWEHSANNSSTSPISGGGFTLAVGGGADFRVAPFLAWRLTADYINAPTSSPAGSHDRVGTGIVFRF